MYVYMRLVVQLCSYVFRIVPTISKIGLVWGWEMSGVGEVAVRKLVGVTVGIE